ncbi:dienelactone hydrolase endo-1-3,1,4-beta-D-glucanase [Flagelloscypha sp. PMI_526]|nr:dienelactone hydrolase endo-1-3,1,4-beta-D-glucanase [Flagelloscypha sp. PMI_526]
MSCPDCKKGEILQGDPQGTIRSDGSYFAAASNPSTNAKKAVVLLTDIFGLGIPNPKILADEFASKLNVDVYVPDLFQGKPIAKPGSLQLPNRAGYKRGWWEWVTFVFSIIRVLPRYLANKPGKVAPRLKAWITSLREEKGYTSVGAVGYCYGGILNIQLGQPGLFESIVCAHPGPFSNEDVQRLASPTVFLCAEDDASFPKRRRIEVEALLASRKGKDGAIEYEFNDYEGTAHGFAARPVLAYPEVAKAFGEAKAKTISWLTATL